MATSLPTPPTSPLSFTHALTQVMKSANDSPTHDFNVQARVPAHSGTLLHAWATVAQLVAGSESGDMHLTHAARSKFAALAVVDTMTRSTSMHARGDTRRSANV